MEAYMSMITPYGCNYIIRNWGACAGGLLSINQFTSLFSLLGTNFGGDGRTSFGLPDLRGRSPVNYGTGPGLFPVQIGQMAGMQYSTLNTLSMPAHHHSVSLSGSTVEETASLSVSTDGASSPDPDGNYLGAASGATRLYATTMSTPAGSQAAVAIPSRIAQFTGSTTYTGAGQSFYSQSPYQGVNYQICMFGLYPSRN
jgi:microcystin-dependent protein